ncbi:DNA alkylation repair protein [Thalassotalea ganghwensis]
MNIPDYQSPMIPNAPQHIVKGMPLKELLNQKAIGYLARNIELAWPEFDVECFYYQASKGLEQLSLMARANHIAKYLAKSLPDDYECASRYLIESFPAQRGENDAIGCAAFFFLPYSAFWANEGTSKNLGFGESYFDTSMEALKALTKQFTSEFAIRPFIKFQQDRTLAVLHSWLTDPNHHVRRLCSEGLRPKLPWGIRLQSFIKDPAPLLPILAALKTDESLYVRRSVANHLGDIAKDHPELVFDLCHQWLTDANKETKWLIRHAVRYYAKAKHPRAIRLRALAK